VCDEIETCFYCEVEVISVPYSELNRHYTTANARTIDHYYPKNHPLYDPDNKVICCTQCNQTKGCGEPLKYIEALTREPLPVWGEKRGTKHWYTRAKYDSQEWRGEPNE